MNTRTVLPTLISVGNTVMRRDKEVAFKLRLGGKSYGEINNTLGISKSTLAGWFSNLVLSEEVKSKIERRTRKKSIAGLIKRNKNQTVLAIFRANEGRRQAAQEVEEISRNSLLILGATLYWAEGYKRPIFRNGRELTYHRVSLTNSDSYLIKAFLLFLREYCLVPEEKIKAGLRIFPHQNEKTLLNYWQKETRILSTNFTKVLRVVSKSSLGKRPFNQLPYGVIQISVADTKLFHKIMGYIEGIKKFV